MTCTIICLGLIVLLFAGSNLSGKKLSNDGCNDLCASLSTEECVMTDGQCYMSGSNCVLDSCAGHAGGLTIDDIFSLGSGDIELGGGLNMGTTPGFSHSQEFDGIYATSYGLSNSDGTEYLTTGSNISVLVEIPVDCIIEVWDLDTMRVISTNKDSPGSALLFTAIPNHHYGGYAWYSTNAQASLLIEAYGFPSVLDVNVNSDSSLVSLDYGNIDPDSNLVSPGDASNLTVDDIFVLGGNTVILGDWESFDTTPGGRWAQEFDGIYAAAYGLANSDGTEYLTTGSNISVLVEIPVDCIIEVWDLETMHVISTNYGSPGSTLLFTAVPNHRYGGYAWYSTNNQTGLLIRTYGLIDYIGSNTILLGGDGRLYTDYAQKFDGINATPYRLANSDGTEYLTTGTNMKVLLLVVPLGCIIEVWDLETMRVISTNYGSPGSALVFTAVPNHRYGGYAWYSTNNQANLEIRTYSEFVNNGNIDSDSILVSPDYCRLGGVNIENVPFECGSGCSSGSASILYEGETFNYYYCHAPANDLNPCLYFEDDGIECTYHYSSSGSFSVQTPTLLVLLLLLSGVVLSRLFN